MFVVILIRLVEILLDATNVRHPTFLQKAARYFRHFQSASRHSRRGRGSGLGVVVTPHC